MERKLYTKDEVARFIHEGRAMVLSGDESILEELPAGNWIGGTTPYFMDKTKGVHTRDRIFVDDFTDIAEDFKIEQFSADTIPDIAQSSFTNGFTVVILPYDAPVYFEFANNSLTYDNIFDNPVVGYVSCFDYADMGKVSAKVFNGETGEISCDKAVALHVELPEHKVARAEILNLDTIQPDSDKIVFPKTAFVQSECTINGNTANIAEYLTRIKYIDNAPRPLIANTNGALINRDIKSIDLAAKQVTFFSPAYAGDTYYLAAIISNYQSLFNKRLEELECEPMYTSICISYYLLGEFENKKINIEGAFALGEIAYQLLNKTLVLLTIDAVE